MNKLIRGGVALAVLCLLVVFIYAQQAKKNDPLPMAPDTQAKIENNIIDIALLDNNLIAAAPAESINDDEKKLVKETASVKATTRGASRGAFTATAGCAPSAVGG